MSSIDFEKFKREYATNAEKFDVEKKNKALLKFLRNDFEFVAQKIVERSVSDFHGILQVGGLFDELELADFKKIWDKVRKENADVYKKVKQAHAEATKKEGVSAPSIEKKEKKPAVKNEVPLPPSPIPAENSQPAVEKSLMPFGEQKKNDVGRKNFKDFNADKMTMPEKKEQIVVLLGLADVEPKIRQVLDLALGEFCDIELTQSILALTDFRNPNEQKFALVRKNLVDFFVEQVPNPNQKLLSAVMRALLLYRSLDKPLYADLFNKPIQIHVRDTVNKTADCFILTITKF